MSQLLNNDEQLQAAVDAYATCPNKVEAAKYLNIPKSTFDNRYNRAIERGFVANGITVKSNEDTTKHRIATLEAQLSSYKRDELQDKYIRSKLFGLSETSAVPPNWLIDSKPPKSSPGVPTLLCSDWHWGETIDPTQIGGVNK